MPKSDLGRVGMLLLLFVSALPGSFLSAQDGRTLGYVGSALWTKAHDIEIHGRLAYCAFLNGLVILDITDLKKPVRLSQLYLGGGLSLEAREGLAFVAAGDKGLNIIDVCNPQSPVLKGMIDTRGDARDVALGGSYAFVADGPEGLIVVDIRNPAAPKSAGGWDSPGESNEIVLRGDLAYIADGSAGLQILNIKNPEKPLRVGTLDTDGTAEGIALSGNHVFVADGASGLKVVDIGNPSRPKLVASLTASGYAHSVSLDGKYLIAGNLYDGGFQVLDITDPAAPIILSTNKYTMYNEGWRVVVKGNLAYVVDYFSGIFFMDISSPQKPAIAGTFFTPSSIVAASVQGGLAYAVGELSGLQVLDLLSSGTAQIRRRNQHL